MIATLRRRKTVRSSKVGTLTEIAFNSLPSPSVKDSRNFAERAASRIKSPTSVESDHWYGRLDTAAKLWKDIRAGSGFSVSELRMSRLTWDKGWAGCRRVTVGGSVDFGIGRMSLKRWDEVGKSFPESGETPSSSSATSPSFHFVFAGAPARNCA